MGPKRFKLSKYLEKTAKLKNMRPDAVILFSEDQKSQIRTSLAKLAYRLDRLMGRPRALVYGKLPEGYSIPGVDVIFTDPTVPNTLRTKD